MYKLKLECQWINEGTYISPETKISFELDGEPSISEYQELIVQFARAIGYPENGIKEVFGEDD